MATKTKKISKMEKTEKHVLFIFPSFSERVYQELLIRNLE